jgi:hypothetical protein
VIQLSLQPVFHLFNTFLPSAAAFMVLSALFSALPDFGKKAKHQMNPAEFSGMKLKKATPLPVDVKMYTIPTSMRTRTSRNY